MVICVLDSVHWDAEQFGYCHRNKFRKSNDRFEHCNGLDRRLSNTYPYSNCDSYSYGDADSDCDCNKYLYVDSNRDADSYCDCY